MRARNWVLWVCGTMGMGAACGGLKAPVPEIDYGAEDAAVSKADSATRPASLEPIALDVVKRATLDAQRRFRALVFDGRAGQRVNVFVDGLGTLDTVLYLYKVSRTTGALFDRPVAYNDDTTKPTWTLLSNAAPNDLSSSAARVTLPETRRYAVVVTTYRQRGVGDVEVRVHGSTTRCDASSAARHHAFPRGVTDPGDVALELTSETEATRYADPQLRTVRWLVREGETSAAQRWVLGFNDLWAQRFEVDRSSCAVTLTGEH